MRSTQMITCKCSRAVLFVLAVLNCVPQVKADETRIDNDRVDEAFLFHLEELDRKIGAEQSVLNFWMLLSDLGPGEFSVWSITDRHLDVGRLKSSCKKFAPPADFLTDGDGCSMFVIRERSFSGYPARQVRCSIRHRQNDTVDWINYECIIDARFRNGIWKSFTSTRRLFVDTEKGDEGKVPARNSIED